MNNKFNAIFIGLIFVSAFVLFGCTAPPICGDNLCQTGEDLTCPTDCVKPINGSIIVNISGGNDATGNIALEYYTSNNVNYNFSNMVNSYIASNWGGSTGKNLSISFNQNEAVALPVPQYGDRQVVITNPKQGEYVFTARSDDYGYFGTSDKVLVDKDGNYYATVELKPSNPVVRVRAVDEQYNQLSGDGSITIFEVVDSCKLGECTHNENQVAQATFSGKDEINGLFYIWTPQNGIDYSSHFKAVVEVSKYGTSINDWIYPYQKYQEYPVTVVKEVPKTGTLTVEIHPGTGTTDADVASLIGSTAYLYNSDTGQQTIIEVKKIDAGNGPVVGFQTDLPYGNYSVNGGISDQNVVPVNFYGYTSVNDPAPQISVNAFVGSLVTLKTTDSTGALLNPSKVLVAQICQWQEDSNGTSPCYDVNRTWADGFGKNPYIFQQGISSDDQLNWSLKSMVSLTLQYNGQTKTFTFHFFRQGINSVEMKFDSGSNSDSKVTLSNPSCIITGTRTITPEGIPMTLNAFSTKIDVNYSGAASPAKCDLNFSYRVYDFDKHAYADYGGTPGPGGDIALNIKNTLSANPFVSTGVKSNFETQFTDTFSMSSGIPTGQQLSVEVNALCIDASGNASRGNIRGIGC